MNDFQQSPSSVQTPFSNEQAVLEMRYLYQAALKHLQVRFEILGDEFKVQYARSPIHHIETRLKSTPSIIRKLEKKGYPVSIESARTNLNDIAGIRVVCGYIDDVYRVADMLLRQSDLTLIKQQDYIQTPNYNGYRSLHLDIEVPIYLSARTERIRAEVQLRTVAMDFWASLEHDLRYKADKTIPPQIGREMLDCANEIAQIDQRMQQIYQKIQALD